MPSVWTAAKSVLFWSKRNWKLVGADENRQQRILEYRQWLTTKDTREREKTTAFTRRFGNMQPLANSSNLFYKKDANRLEFWMKHGSWTYCKKCRQLIWERLFPRFANKPVMKTKAICSCSKDRYVIPKKKDIPKELRDLSVSEIVALRPLDIHDGEYEKHPGGYRKKGGMFRLDWSSDSVDTKIARLPRDSRRQCRKAYNYLMNSTDSSYKSYVDRREEAISEGLRFNLYDYDKRNGVECALWPHLYPFTAWCETVLDGRQSRLSSKIAYITKCQSEIPDYGMSHELLHFHYDLWIWTTVTGAVATAKKHKCTPNKALEDKTFSPEYWRWQHRLLLDAVRQFGFPTLFITISPFEWSFPFPQWLDNLRDLTGYGPTCLPTFETTHIVHSFFFIRTSNFDAEAERSYIFWRFEAETFLKMFLNLPGIVFQPISADVTRQTIKEQFLLRYGIKLLAHTGLTCSDATCEMSRQPTLAKFGFKKRIDHRGLQQDINLLDFVAKTPKKFTCSTCSKAFINQQGLSVHVKCVHGVVAEGKILAKSSDSTPKTESENEIQTAVSSTMDKILSLVAEESSSSEKGNTNM